MFLDDMIDAVNMKAMGVRMKMAKIMRKNHATLEVRNLFTILTSV